MANKVSLLLNIMLHVNTFITCIRSKLVKKI